MKKLVKKNKIKINKKKMHKKISNASAVMAIFLVGAFFSVLIWQKEMREISDASANFFPKNYSKEKIRKSNKVENNNGSVYENKELGFRVMLPKDERRYAVKELDPKGQNRAIAFGLPTNDAEIKQAKKEDYSEIFRIELVPTIDLNKKKCSDVNRQYPLCDGDDQELGRNDQFVFVYTRYDKLDTVEKNRAKFVPADFDAAVFAQADEISKSFRLIPAQVGMAL